MLLFPFQMYHISCYFFLPVVQVIRNLLGDDADMLSLYLTHPDRQDGEQVEKQKELVFAWFDQTLFGR